LRGARGWTWLERAYTLGVTPVTIYVRDAGTRALLGVFDT
jgi:hypothetical protein